MPYKPFMLRAETVFREPITEAINEAGAKGHRTIGYADYTVAVDVEIDIDAIVRLMGAAAGRNKTGKSVDGKVTVKRAGKPVKVRELYYDANHRLVSIPPPDDHSGDRS